MATDQPAEKGPEDVLKLEEALSGRSTCKATGEKIEKGQWRVGIEAWRAGRNTMTWQKADAFLKNCFVEECTKGNSGTCKLTGHKFVKEETRFAMSTGEKKIYLSIPAAAAIIQPVIDVCEGKFSTSDIKGLDEIPQADRKLLLKEFKTKEGSRSKRPAPDSAAEDDGAEKTSSAKRRKSRRNAKVKKEEEDEDTDEDDKENVLKVEGEAADIGSDVTVKADEEEGEEGGGEEDADGPASPTSPGVPEYERERQAIMARNREKMKALGIQQLAADIMPASKPKPRSSAKGVSKKKKTPYEGPRRTSLRQRGVHSDGKMVEVELGNGRVLTAQDPNPCVWQRADEEPAEPPAPKERHSKEAKPFESEEDDKGQDEKFLQLLKKSVTGTTKGEKGKTRLHELDLLERNVAKMTSNGISHIQWHPSSSAAIVASADKSGNIGLWNLSESSSQENDDDILLSFTPHNQYISGLRWAGSSGAPKLFSGSYDGSMRCLDPSTGQFEVVVSNEEADFSAMDCTADGNVAILGDSDGYFHIYDIRENKGEQRGKEGELHNKRVNTLHFSPGEEHIFLSASADNSLAVWDLRSLGGKTSLKSLANAVHPKTCQSAYFAPDGSRRVVSLSRDDTIKIWEFNGKAQLIPKVSISHYNNTGRWVLPFRATWSPSADAIVVGNMKRKVDIISTDGKQLGSLQSDYMTAISSRAAVHPDLGFLAAATASGRVHIYK